jgi:hypothetical protein
MDFEDDEYLQQVLHDLNEGIDRDKLAFQIAKQAIVRGFLTRADFAAEQALVVRLKMREAVRENDKNYLLSVKADIDDVENEVKHTLEVLQSFQRILSPRLDLSVETLRGVWNTLSCPNPQKKTTWRRLMMMNQLWLTKKIKKPTETYWTVITETVL